METRVAPYNRPQRPSRRRFRWRIFINSCTVQTMREYGEFIYDSGSISDSNKIHRIPDGFENVMALRDICQVTSRALFQWIVSDASRQEARAKGDPDHLQWLYEVAHYARAFLDERPAQRLRAKRSRPVSTSPNSAILGQGDRILLQDAIFLQCNSFLTMERKLPKNAAHIECELGNPVLTSNQLLGAAAALGGAVVVTGNEGISHVLAVGSGVEQRSGPQSALCLQLARTVGFRPIRSDLERTKNRPNEDN